MASNQDGIFKTEEVTARILRRDSLEVGSLMFGFPLSAQQLVAKLLELETGLGDDEKASTLEGFRKDIEFYRRIGRRVRLAYRKLRFFLAPTVEECLTMLRELEAELGGERAAAVVIGPSLVTLRSWKRRKSMSMSSRRLVWLVWALVLYPETLKSEFDLITSGHRSRSRGANASTSLPLVPGVTDQSRF